MIAIAGGEAIVAAGAKFPLWPADDMGPPTVASTLSQELFIACRGAYLAKAGDCSLATRRAAACPTRGRALQTPFGKVLSPNITADKETGIGSWTATDTSAPSTTVHRKTAEGRIRPFPTPATPRCGAKTATPCMRISRACRRNKQANAPHGSCASTRIALAAWRALYFAGRVPAFDE